MIKKVKEKISLTPVDKKLYFGFGLSLVVIILLSTLLYSSKVELKKSAELLQSNSELRISIHDMLISLNKLEALRKKYLLTGDKTDSINYFNDLSEVKKEIKNFYRLVGVEEKTTGYLDSLENTVNKQLSYFYSHPVITKEIISGDQKLFNREEIIFKKIESYLDSLNYIEEGAGLAHLTDYEAQSVKNIIHFFILLFVYLLILSIFFWITIKDVKKRLRVEEELAENSNKLKAIIDTAASFIFVKDTERKFNLVNRSFLNFFNSADQSSLISRDNSALLSNYDIELAEQEDNLVFKERKVLKDIERQLTINNEQKWLSINKAPLIDKDNNVIGIVGVMDDITKRKAYEAELQEAKEKLAELNHQKDKFFSIIAHDLRSPFTGLLGYSDFLVNDYGKLSEDEKKEYINSINETLKSLLDLINNLLEWSKLQFKKEEVTPEEFTLHSVTTKVFNSLKISSHKKNITLAADCPESIKIYSDKNMVETVLRNLVSNAIKFTKTKGTVKVTVEDNDGMISINVKDNGIGMSEETVQNLFKLNTSVTRSGTANEKGTGLGLLICKEFLEKHGGSISVKSKVNEGTIFTVKLKSGR